MGNEFKIGDRVRRFKNPRKDMPIGFTSVVDRVAGEWHISLSKKRGTWAASNFELIKEEKERPWLRVTPPQPEKRELMSSDIGCGIRMTVYDSDAGGVDMIHLASNVSYLDKVKVKELGETLIEISKEMK